MLNGTVIDERAEDTVSAGETVIEVEYTIRDMMHVFGVNHELAMCDDARRLAIERGWPMEATEEEAMRKDDAEMQTACRLCRPNDRNSPEMQEVSEPVWRVRVYRPYCHRLEPPYKRSGVE